MTNDPRNPFSAFPPTQPQPPQQPRQPGQPAGAPLPAVPPPPVPPAGPTIQPSARLGSGALGGPALAGGALPAGSTPGANPAADDCTSMIARLYHFLDGELTDDRRTSIQSHLDACPTCFGAYDFEAELRIVVRSRLQTHVPESLIERVRSLLRRPGSPL